MDSRQLWCNVGRDGSFVAAFSKPRLQICHRRPNSSDGWGDDNAIDVGLTTATVKSRTLSINFHHTRLVLPNFRICPKRTNSALLAARITASKRKCTFYTTTQVVSMILSSHQLASVKTSKQKKLAWTRPSVAYVSLKPSMFIHFRTISFFWVWSLCLCSLHCRLNELLLDIFCIQPGEQHLHRAPSHVKPQTLSICKLVT